METDFQLRYKKRDKLSTYSLIFWSTSHGECQVTRSRFRNPEENHSVSMPFSTLFISWKGEEKVSAFLSPSLHCHQHSDLKHENVSSKKTARCFSKQPFLRQRYRTLTSTKLHWMQRFTQSPPLPSVRYLNGSSQLELTFPNQIICSNSFPVVNTTKTS